MSSKYHRKIDRDAEGLSDVYDILRAFAVNDSAVAHAVKKLLAPGQRSGGKSYLQDLEEARWSLDNAIDRAKREADPSGWVYDAVTTTWTKSGSGHRLRIWRQDARWHGDVVGKELICFGPDDERTLAKAKRRLELWANVS